MQVGNNGGEVLMYNIEMLRSSETQLTRVIHSLQEIHGAIECITSRSQPFWEGKASAAFTELCQELQGHIATYREDLILSRNTLDDALKAYEKTEKVNQNSVGDLDTNDIF
jgi:uncharacterized protein YukE